MQASSTPAGDIHDLRIQRGRTLREMGAEQIRKAIQRGDLRAGQRVTELGLAQLLGVAQATVREALVELEYQGFIDRRGPRKTFVTTLSRDDINDIYLVRTRLETLAVELLTSGKRADLEPAEREQADMVLSALAGDHAAYYRADLDFHRALWRATGNASLREALERLVPKLFAFGIIQHARPSKEKLLATAMAHGELLALIRNRQTERAAKLMAESMETAWVEDAELPAG